MTSLGILALLSGCKKSDNEVKMKMKQAAYKLSDSGEIFSNRPIDDLAVDHDICLIANEGKIEKIDEKGQVSTVIDQGSPQRQCPYL